MEILRSIPASVYAAWTKSANKPFVIIATILVLLAIAEAFGQAIGDGSKISILLGLAIVTLLAPRLENLSLGSDGIKAALNKVDEKNIKASTEIDDNLNQKIDALYKEVMLIKELIHNGGCGDGGGSSSGNAAPGGGIELDPPTHADDPQKDRFGGKEQRDGRILCAVVEQAALNADWCSVKLTVKKTRGGADLAGVVSFFLHDTFTPDRYDITVKDGEARLTVRAVGAFTVGAIVDGGTLLELDLATSPNVTAPQYWRVR